jgi:hypothetical protein
MEHGSLRLFRLRSIAAFFAINIVILPIRTRVLQGYSCEIGRAFVYPIQSSQCLLILTQAQRWAESNSFSSWWGYVSRFFLLEWYVIYDLLLFSLKVLQDQTIMATAGPTISNEFQSLEDIAWWTNIYLLTLASFQLFYGKLYSLFSVKFIYIGAIVIFEIGSLICTTAPNSIALIVGRAIAGFGASGIFSGGLLIVSRIIPLARRPMYLGIMSAVFGIAAIAGPFIGGALTQKATWR